VDVYDESLSTGYVLTSGDEPLLVSVAGQDLDDVDFGYHWLSGSTCVTIQRPGSTHDQVLDAYIWAADPNANSGDATMLYSGLVLSGEKQSLLWFDLSGIPADAVVDLATFSIYLHTSNDQFVRVHRITAPWSETAVTWNNFGSGFDSAVEDFLVSQGTGYHYVDLTELAQGWMDGTYDNYGVLLEQNLSTYDTYKSSEYSNSTVRPRLRVCYHGGTTTPTPTPTPTPTSTPTPTPTPTSTPTPGGLVQEAEDGVLTGDFVVGSDGAASGGQYVHVPDAGVGLSSPDEGQKVSYSFTVDTPGTYRIKAWVYGDSGTNDSFFVKVDGNPAAGYLWDMQMNTTYQDDYVSDRNGADPVEVTLTAGQHTVAFYLREDGARLDKIELELMPDSTPTPTPTPTPIPGGGLVQEAEGGVLTGDFVVGSDGAASGGQYVHVPDAGVGLSSPDEGQKVSYSFTVDTPGTYRIKAWVYGDSGTNDSFFVKVDGSPAAGYLWDMQMNTTYQDDYVSDRNGADPVEVTLTAGQHTIAFYLREDGARLDKIELELMPDSTPTPPIAAFTAAPVSGTVPLTVTFTDQSSADAITRTWDLDGVTQTLTSADPVSHTYTTPGIYTITLTVENAAGLSDTTSLTITASVSQSVPSILSNGGFETGDLSDWNLNGGTMNVITSAAHSGVYGVKMSSTGSIAQLFDTVAGQTYYVSAWIRIDQEITTPSWGGLLVKVVDLPSWTTLVQSDFLQPANSPVGTWTYVNLSFVAVGSTSRIEFTNFSGGGQFDASADDFIVSLTPIP
jgi:PKD repeat protein